VLGMDKSAATRAGDDAQRPLLRDGWLRLAVIGAIAAIGAVIWAGQVTLTRQFAEEQSVDATLRATLYAGNIQSTMQRHSVVPLLLARDPVLMIALRTGRFEEAEARINGFREELGAGAIFLLDDEGTIVATTDSSTTGGSDADRDYFKLAVADSGTVFSVIPSEEGPYGFFYARKVEVDGQLLGVIVVKVDLGAIEESWRRAIARVVVTNSDDEVLLSSLPNWRRNTLANLLASGPGSSQISSALQTARQSIGPSPYVYIAGTPHLRAEVPVGFRNWRLSYFATLEEVRARVNAVLAMLVMALALFAALAFYRLSRRTRAESRRFKKESDELRVLNRRLSAEIAARQRLEINLKEAEQSLEQASKLAALGQMSAAVSHELNQPLAAMKTYLAGARLLLNRRRPEEALSSFQRIDDLIDRMGGITRQLKSYARKGEVELKPVDVREAVRAALSMMAPQLGKMAVTITTTLPSEPVVIMADPLRLEQIIVNLLRNALDAVRGQPERSIRILLVQGEAILLSIADNGPGIRDPEQLFEPFYTTKKPGEGLGLGLAISAGFAGEMGGRLVARNAPEGGAVFELLLPREQAQTRAAE
jgi:two-component system, NtrC family, C4-dicarboxylate transport sensor histidine kinase DctB